MTTQHRLPENLTTEQLLGEITTIEGTLGMAFKQMGASYDASKITVFSGDTASKSAQVHDLNERLVALRDEHGGRPASGTRRITPLDYSESKSLGDRVADSGFLHRNSPDFEVPWSIAEAKTLFETGAGWAPENARSNRVALGPTRPISGVLDLLPVVTSHTGEYTYMQETYANAAVETAEAGDYAEGTLSLAEVSEPVRKTAVFLPVTDEQIDDESQARAYIDQRLPFLIRQRVDGQLINGDGSAPNISGFLDREGINAQAIGSDPIFDAIYKGADKCRTVGYAEPDAVIMHPVDYRTMRLTTTADGIYLMGNPGVAGSRAAFDMPVVVTTAIAQGTALVGAFRDHAALISRSGIDVRISDSHADYFIKGKQVVRASLRVGLAVYRPEAFTEVTLT